MEPLPEHTIQFSGLKDGQHRFAFELGDAFFAATGMDEYELGGQVQATVIMDKSDHLLVTTIHVEGHANMPCDHCNAPLRQPVKGDQRQIFQLSGEAAIDDEELVGLSADAHEVNLTHYLFECISLSLPIRHVHPEGQCDPEAEAALGRVQVDEQPDGTSAHEAQADPRWDALKTLKDREN